jgi:hypothetical protein
VSSRRPVPFLPAHALRALVGHGCPAGPPAPPLAVVAELDAVALDAIGRPAWRRAEPSYLRAVSSPGG